MTAANNVAHGAAHSVIIDTDPGVDDAIALLFAFLSPNVDIRAITLVQGNTNVQKAFRNLRQILTVQAAHERFLATHKASATVQPPQSLVSREAPVVVALGQGEPLEGKATYAEYYHGPDGLGNFFPKPSAEEMDPVAAVDAAATAAGTTQQDVDTAEGLYTLSSRFAEDEILHQLATNPPNTISIVAVGPLSNVARAIRKDPETMSRVKAIFTMGGAINVPGNVTPVAEFNWYADPLAAHILIASSLPVRVLPLDVTMVSSIVDSEYLIAHAEPLHTPLSDFVVKITEWVLDLSERQWGFRKLTMHDPLTIGALVDESLVTFAPLDFQVEPTGTFTKAQCVVDRRITPPAGAVGGGSEPQVPRTNILVAVKGDTHKFLEMFYRTLFGLDWNSINIRK